MKLRIKGSSIRLRLTQTEVKEIAEGRACVEELCFAPGKSLKYSLVGTTEAAENVEYSGTSLCVQIPQKDLVRWASSEEVGIEFFQENGESDQLKILVEKDFACLKPREGEDDSDAFPNPNLSC